MYNHTELSIFPSSIFHSGLPMYDINIQYNYNYVIIHYKQTLHVYAPVCVESLCTVQWCWCLDGGWGVQNIPGEASSTQGSVRWSAGSLEACPAWEKEGVLTTMAAWGWSFDARCNPEFEQNIESINPWDNFILSHMYTQHAMTPFFWSHTTHVHLAPFTPPPPPPHTSQPHCHHKEGHWRTQRTDVIVRDLEKKLYWRGSRSNVELVQVWTTSARETWKTCTRPIISTWWSCIKSPPRSTPPTASQEGVTIPVCPTPHDAQDVSSKHKQCSS